jgi:ATP-dependent DNA ligase
MTIPGAFNRARTAFELPPIKMRGNRAEWRIAVSVAEHGTHIIPISREMRANEPLDASIVGVITSRIDSQIFVPTYVYKGKNIGRANETNVFCQALRDAYSIHLRHLRRAQPARVTPMLARVARDDDRAWTREVYVQRKYNGLRALATLDRATQSVILYGRRGLIFTGFPYIKQEIARIIASLRDTRQVYLDGELYKHGLPLQTISGIARRGATIGAATNGSSTIGAATNGSSTMGAATNGSSTQDLNYVVYDVFFARDTEADDTLFSERLASLRAIASLNLRAVIVAETFTCVGESRAQDVRNLYARFLREGYEGAIVRLDAPYDHSGASEYHSPNLLKLKPLFDAEFTIVDYARAEKGRAKGALLFVCETAGARFLVTPTGSIDTRKRMAREFARATTRGRTVFDTHWRGKPLIVMYEELSTRGIPQRARTDGIIREFA